MSTVNTVLGPVDVADLKFTLMHEHVHGQLRGHTAHVPGADRP